MLRLAEVQCDNDERPLDPHKIKTAEVFTCFRSFCCCCWWSFSSSSSTGLTTVSSRCFTLRLMTLYLVKPGKARKTKIKRRQRNRSQEPQSESTDFICRSDCCLFWWDSICLFSLFYLFYFIIIFCFHSFTHSIQGPSWDTETQTACKTCRIQLAM